MIKKQFFLVFFGFMGLIGLHYFSSGNLSDLGFLGFFAFFANFFIGKIKGDKADERYIENCKQAKAFAFHVGTVLLFLCWALVFSTKNAELAYFLLPLLYAVLLNLYAVKLYRLEEN